MRTFIAILVAPLGSVLVLAAVLLGSLIRDKSWPHFFEALIGFSAITYFVYFIWLLLVFPIYLLLKSRGKAHFKVLLLLSAAFGGIVTLPVSLYSPAWLAVGIAMGTGAGLVFHSVLVDGSPSMRRLNDSSDPKMTKSHTVQRLALATLVVVAIISFSYRDEVFARINGAPVTLLYASGSLNGADALEEFTHAHIQPNGALRLVMRAYFHRSGPLARPYLQTDQDGRGVLHIEVMDQLRLFFTKCEFTRQLEIELEADQWRSLKSLTVFNHDLDYAIVADMPLTDKVYLDRLLRVSKEQLTLASLDGISSGC